MLGALNFHCSQWDVRTLYTSAGRGHTKPSLLPLCLLGALGEPSPTSGTGAALTWVLDLGVKQKRGVNPGGEAERKGGEGLGSERRMNQGLA